MSLDYVIYCAFHGILFRGAVFFRTRCINAERVTHLNSSAYSALYFWSYFILGFFLGGVSQSSRFGSPSAIFFVYVYVTEPGTCCLHSVVLPILRRHCAKRLIYTTKHNFVHQFDEKSGVSSKNRTRIIWTSKSGDFRENREGWQLCISAKSGRQIHRQGYTDNTDD